MNTVTSSVVTKALPQTRKAKSRVLVLLKRGLFGLLVALIALPLSGATYEAIMALGDAQRYPPPGKLVDVGGYNLHIYCVGQGSPTVILEAGGGHMSLDWVLIQPDLAKSTRVCAYDRAGLGWSEAGTLPRSPQQITADLYMLLAEAGISGPYVLVGHSIGGKYVRLYASQYPQDVAGMVLLDARHESLDAAQTPEQKEQDRAQTQNELRLTRTLRRLGILRLFGPSLLKANPSAAHIPEGTLAEMALVMTGPQGLDAQSNEFNAQTQADDQLQAAPSLGDIPLIVMGADQSIARIPILMDAFTTMMGLSSNSRLMIVQKSGHAIHWDQPMIVIDAILQVVDAARTGEPLILK